MHAARDIQLVDRPEAAARLLKPMRVSILNALGSGASAAAVARTLSLPRQKVNYHLRELERAGLAELVEERRKGNCTERILRARATRYVIDPSVFGPDAPDPEEITDHFSSAYLAALAAQVVREIAGLRRQADAAGQKLATMSVQSEVRFRDAASRHAFAEELTRTISKLVAKYHAPEAPGGRTFRLVAGAYPRPRRATGAAAKEPR